MSQMQETSIEEFEKLRPHLSRRESEVFNKLFELEYATNAMIAKALGWSVNRITGRIYSLREKGLVFFSHTSWCPVGGGKAHYWTTKLKDGEDV